MKLLSFLSVLGASAAFAHEFTICRNQKDQLGVKEVTFLPDPPKSGKTVSVSVKGVSDVDMSAGKMHVDVRVLGVTVGTQVLDVCSILACPLVTGQEYQGVVAQEIPAGTPDKMGATVRLTVFNENGQSLSCLESYVQIKNDESIFSAEAPRLELLKEEIEFLFQKWTNEYPKAVHNLEVFAQNLKKILTHNNKDSTFKMAMNEFGSLTEDEFVSTRMGIRQPREDVERNGPIIPRTTMLRQDVARADPPEEVDWSLKGVVAPVKNQGSCGSCWAFSAVGSLESAYALKTGKLVQFSEQELVSCDNNDYGCQGGLMDSAFDWIERSSAGLCSETDYGYTSGSTSANGACMKETCTPIPDSVPKGYVDVPPNEAALRAAIAQNGPVSVAIEADQSVFQFYHSGVLTGACGTHLNHGVLLIGYGVDEPTGTPFWKVKNSWGAGWGEAGYVRIQRGKRWPMGGECGIATKASYPVF